MLQSNCAPNVCVGLKPTKINDDDPSPSTPACTDHPTGPTPPLKVQEQVGMLMTKVEQYFSLHDLNLMLLDDAQSSQLSTYCKLPSRMYTETQQTMRRPIAWLRAATLASN